jgi:hypothetical protein
MGVLTSEVEAHLKVEDAALQSDRKRVLSRRAAGVVGAAVLGAAPLALHEVFHHATAGGNRPKAPQHGPGNPNQAHGTGGTPAGETAAEANHWAQIEVHNHNPLDYGSHGVAVAEVGPHQDAYGFAQQHLERMQGWHNFDHAQRDLKIRHFADQLMQQNFRPGAHIRWDFGMINGSFNYER